MSPFVQGLIEDCFEFELEAVEASLEQSSILLSWESGCFSTGGIFSKNDAM